MFEPQDHPNDFQYPGGPPIPPYDNAGWTLAFQMGLKFDRVLDAFDGPFEKIPDVIKPAPGKVTDAAGAVGYVVNHKNNDAFTAVNRLLKANEEAFFVGDRRYQSTDGTGVIFITAKPTTKAILDKAALDLGLNFTAVTARPAGAMYKLTKPRIGLWDRVRRLDAVGPRALAARAVRVRLRARVPGHARRRQPQVEVRRAAVPRRRHSGDRGGGGGGFGGAPAAPRTKFPRSIARTSAASRSRDGSAAEGVRGSRRRDRRVRRIGGARPSSRPAGQRSPRRSRAGRQPSGRCPARSPTFPAACCRSPSTTPTRSPSASRRRSTCSSTTAR